MCKATIIVISYNENAYLPKALESCVRQTLKDLEIIIGDDGSSDGSLETIQQYAMRYPQIQYFQMERPAQSSGIIPSIRVSNIIRRALEMAKGEYICVLSGDDYFCDNNKLRDAVSYLDERPDYIACVSGFKFVGAKDGTFFSTGVSPALYWSGEYQHISCFVFRKPLIEQLPGRMFDDTGLQYLLARMGKWHYSDTVTFAYNQREASIMSSADSMELDILEIMLFQDILNERLPHSLRFRWATGSRFHRPLRNCFRHRQELAGNDKYKKYILSCGNYPHDILGRIRDYDSQSLRSRVGTLLLLVKNLFQRIMCKCILRIVRCYNRYWRNNHPL